VNSIFRKEINLFFSSVSGYVAIAVFLAVTALFLFVFPGDLNIFLYGFATLDPFFELAPLVFLFLIPAVTMRSIAEEKSLGTMEIIVTKPVSDWKIVGGKYLASLALLLFALIPTLVYAGVISSLALPQGAVDWGGIAGSYAGLFLVASSFAAIGIFASALTSNQIVAFIAALFFCFAGFFAFDFISKISVFSGNIDYLIRQIGMNAHYLSVSRGVLDLRDVFYFFSVNVLFLSLAKTAIESRKWE
jgi:ABC-2 type transport system permease protein